MPEEAVLKKERVVVSSTIFRQQTGDIMRKVRDEGQRYLIEMRGEKLAHVDPLPDAATLATLNVKPISFRDVNGGFSYISGQVTKLGWVYLIQNREGPHGILRAPEPPASPSRSL